MPNKRIRGLDGLRGLAALLVFFEHRLPGTNLHLGGYGVRLFFVLSGFLIIGGLASQRENAAFEDRGSLRKLGRFYLKRSLRIFPIYYLILAGAAVIALSGLSDTLTRDELPWHAAFLTNFYEGLVLDAWLPQLGHLWSLSIEEQFYLIIAPVMIFARSQRVDRLCIAIMGVAALQAVVLHATGASAIRLTTDSVITFGFIALGGYLAVAETRAVRLLQRADPLVVGVAYLVIPVLLAASQAGLMAELASTVIAAALVGTVAAHQQSRLVAALENRRLLMLGRISYGFYLYHYFITAENLRAVSGGWLDIGGLPLLAQVGVLFLITYGAARLSWAMIERPALALKDRLLAPRPDAGGHLVAPSVTGA